MSKREKKQLTTLDYLKRLKAVGIFGVCFSILLIGYDIYTYDNWISILSLVVDGLLLLFSIYFIVKSVKLTKKENNAKVKKSKKKSK